MTKEEKLKYLTKMCEGVDTCDHCKLHGVCKAEHTISEFGEEEMDMVIEFLESQNEEPTDSNSIDMVSHPPHYEKYSIECIDAMRETRGVEATKQFCICNAFKYLWRHNSKNGDEDIKKASWYLNKAVSLMEGEST